jgi:hypothetical protein
MRYKRQVLVIAIITALITLIQCTKTFKNGDDTQAALEQKQASEKNKSLIAQGKQIFRFDDFADTGFWSGLLHIDQAIAGMNHGGFGPGVSPKAALGIGLKVDVDALTPDVIQGIVSGVISLDSPSTTLALLKLNAVVGVNGYFNQAGALESIGITCASCHSTVDNSFDKGIGHRLDAWPNRDLDVGGIISLTDNALPIANLLHVDEPTLRHVLDLWGPGKFSAILFMDGKAFNTVTGNVAANLIPAAFGLKDVELTTYTGWGSISYWNAFVANLEMHGKGNFSDPRLNDPVKYPIAVENHFYEVTNNPDLITSKLPALRAYQHSIEAPEPPAGSFNPAAAAKGKSIFLTKAQCATCHPPPLLADNRLHKGAEIGIDDFEANRAPDSAYRTTPLGGLFARAQGGFFHDGRFATLSDVINHYNSHFSLNLTAAEKRDLEEYLKSL